MAWILLVLQTNQWNQTPIGEQAMRYQATIFETLLKELPRGQFDRLVAHHNSDYRSRKLSSWSHLVSMIYAQLSGAQSLRDLEHSLNSHGNSFYHLGINAVHRTTLADANAGRNAELFEDVFGYLLGRLQGQLKRQMKEGAEVLRLLDSTLLPLPSKRAAWARSWKGKSGIKAHVVYDPDNDLPVYYTTSKARKNDITAAKAMPLERGATYVFDRGYVDFSWWLKLTQHDCRFVTRLTRNVKTNVFQERAVTTDTIRNDCLFHLNDRLSRNRKNPYQQPLRKITVIVEGRQDIELITNDLEAPAQQIAHLYKTRWQIELFFKWVKQNLRIKRFLGLSMNALRIQVATAMIAFLLIRLAKEKAPNKVSMQSISRLVRANLMHRKPWAKLYEPPPKHCSRKTQSHQIQWSF